MELVVDITTSGWSRVRVDQKLIAFIETCTVCGQPLEQNSIANIYSDDQGVPRFAVHRWYRIDGTRCTTIFIGAFVSNYLYAQGLTRGDCGVDKAYAQLSSIFGLSRRHLMRLYNRFANNPQEG